MLQVLSIAEIVIAVVLAIIILLQEGDNGLGTMFGGAGGESYRSKRGVEALFYKLTIILVIAFVVNAFAIAIIASK
jgi:protein translocase SecG subunit